ncbi:MAG: hypothetical protein WED82_04725 [Balneolales bacterium]
MRSLYKPNSVNRYPKFFLRNGTILLSIILLTACLDDYGYSRENLEPPQDGDDNMEDPSGIPNALSSDLKILPENTNYFEYKGLPMVLFGSQGTQGHGIIYRPYELDKDRIKQVAKHANHIYLTILPDDANRETGWEGLHSKIKTPHDQGEWAHLTKIAQWAHEYDVIVHMFPWSYKWNYTKHDWSGSDFIYSRDSSEWDKVVTNGLTKLDLHKLAIDRIVGATWEYPNVVYNFMWEYNVRKYHGQDADGSFHRWWVNRMKEKGTEINPDVSHLFSIKYGEEHPRETNADFIIEEDGNGFFHNHSHHVALAHKVPLVFIASDYVFADNNFTGWSDVKHSPRSRENGQNSVHNITPDDVRAMITEGFHPAENWHNSSPDALEYYLQARWYMENISSWNNEPGDEISEGNLPEFTPSERPQLINPDNHVDGRNGEGYSVIYRHPEGLPPAQAEVWIDVNEDGRFDPIPANDERFTMDAYGSDYKKGVVYTITAPAGKRYIFRFADANWNPPVSGDLILGNVAGISYEAF